MNSKYLPGFPNLNYVWLFLLCIVLTPCLAHPASPPLIVIDPGHSNSRQGATSCSGIGESTYNQILSKRISDTLKTSGITVLTTTSGQDMTLAQRAEISQGSGLLLSVHHDSVQQQFMPMRNSGKGEQFCSQRAQGFSLFVSRQNSQYLESLRLAKALGTALVRRGITPSGHHADKIPGENRVPLDSSIGIYLFDELGVLKAAPSPAILLEAAVIVHPDNDKLAQTIEYQQAIADSVNEIAITLLQTVRQK